MIPPILMEKDIQSWIEEDIPFWDLSAAIIPPHDISTAKIIAKEDGVICGLNVINLIFTKFQVKFSTTLKDGAHVKKGETLCLLDGPSIAILQAERTAINIFSHLSGIATATHRYCMLIYDINSKVRVAATRKTLPGLRKYEKWAIVCGGGDTHRLTLSDMVLLKENHIASIGSITKAVEEIRSNLSFSAKIEVEVRNLVEVEEAAKLKVEIIMLDNFDLDRIQPAINIIRKLSPLTQIEISGNVSENTIAQYAKFDVNIISVGKLTHSSKSFDMSLLFDTIKA